MPPSPPGWGNFGQGFPSWEPGGFERVPRRSKRPKLWWLAGTGALAAAGAIASLLFAAGSAGAPQPAAQEVITKANTNNLGALEGRLCQVNRPTLKSQLSHLSSVTLRLRLGEVIDTGDTAQVQVTGTYSAGGTTRPVDQTILLTVEHREWKLCDLAL